MPVGATVPVPVVVDVNVTLAPLVMLAGEADSIVVVAVGTAAALTVRLSVALLGSYVVSPE